MARRTPEAFARKKIQHKKWGYKRVARLRAMKEGVPCRDCGISYPPEVMEYDHVRGEKLFSVGANPRIAWGKLMAEIAKCDLVCANCHRIRHFYGPHKKLRLA